MSEYKRLTERDEYGNADIIGLSTEKLFGELYFDEINLLTKALNKLAFLEDKIEKGLLVPRYSISQDWQYGWWCVCEVDEQSRIIAQCRTKEEAKRKLEELTNERKIKSK